MAGDSQIPVKVALRCRPLVSKERSEGCRTCLSFVPNEPQVVLGTNKAFTFDNTFAPEVAQKEVYEKTVQTLIPHIFKGFNVTVVAYGQTGSGKTYTMGTIFSVSITEDPEKMGIIPRSMSDIFHSIDDMKGSSEFLVKVSFLEIYKEEVLDLLNPIRIRNKDDLIIREDPSGGVKVVGLYEIPVNTIDGAMHCLEQGSLARTTGATAMNAHSSRSHAIFTITVECRAHDDGLSYVSKFNFVDLAGSERAKKTQAQGDRFKEGVNINLGLLALGNVISALGDNSKNGGQSKNHVPYRESKLTRLLQDSLGGNSHTTMIACVSPADSNMEETLNTLRYADRARKIKNKPIVNHDPAASEIARLRNQLQLLQVQIISQVTVASEDSGGDVRGLLDRNKALEEENRRLVQALQNAIDHTTDLNEKAFMAELAKEKVQRKLDDFQKMAGHSANMLNNAVSAKTENENPQLLEQVNLMIDLQNSIVELKTFHKNSEDLLRSSFMNNQTLADVPEFGGANDQSAVDAARDVSGMALDDTCMSTESALRQVAMNNELRDLNRLLAKKEQQADQLVCNDEKVIVMKEYYERAMKELESEVFTLQTEKEDLSHALKNGANGQASSKIAEQRRKRVMELEAQISTMRKKIQEFSKIVKMKEQSDMQVKKLNSEIQEMKRTRVKLMRQMKSESDRLRQYKLEKEKEVCKLKQMDRRRQCEFARKQQTHEKQQNVLKRKFDEAVSANRRLKNALMLQKQGREKDSQGKGSTPRSADKWLDGEIELVVSAREAQFHLDTLLEDRKSISEQIHRLNKRLGIDSSGSDNTGSDESLNGSGDDDDGSDPAVKVARLQEDLDLRNIQICDLQQKLLDIDHDDKGKIRFNSIQLMSEAKYALKYLFDMCVTSKVSMIMKEALCAELRQNLEEAAQTYQQDQNKLSQMKMHHAEQLTELEANYENKILVMMRQLPSSCNNTTSDSVSTIKDDEHLKENLVLLQDQVAKLLPLHDLLVEKDLELNAIKQQFEELQQVKSMEPSLPEIARGVFESPFVPAIKKHKKKGLGKLQGLHSSPFHFDTSDSEMEDSQNDPDWTQSPLLKGIRRATMAFGRQSTATTNFSMNGQGVKRKSDSNGCRCTTGCSTNRCSCRKGKKVCDSQCGCISQECMNNNAKVYGADTLVVAD